MSRFNGTAENIEDNRNKVTSISEKSTNSQYPSAKAVFDLFDGMKMPDLNGCIRLWQPNTEYKVDDVVIGDISFDGFYYFQAILFCKRNHTSENELHEDMRLNLYEDVRSGMWGVKPFISREAECDKEGNFIHETYATKKEVGNIETALDGIIAIQNQLIGGDA